MATMNLVFDDTLRNHFKAACAKKGKTMKGELIRFMTQEIAKAEKGKS